MSGLTVVLEQNVLKMLFPILEAWKQNWHRDERIHQYGLGLIPLLNFIDHFYKWWCFYCSCVVMCNQTSVLASLWLKYSFEFKPWQNSYQGLLALKQKNINLSCHYKRGQQLGWVSWLLSEKFFSWGFQFSPSARNNTSFILIWYDLLQQWIIKKWFFFL